MHDPRIPHAHLDVVVSKHAIEHASGVQSVRECVCEELLEVQETPTDKERALVKFFGILILHEAGSFHKTPDLVSSLLQLGVGSVKYFV